MRSIVYFRAIKWQSRKKLLVQGSMSLGILIFKDMKAALVCHYFLQNF